MTYGAFLAAPTGGILPSTKAALHVGKTALNLASIVDNNHHVMDSAAHAVSSSSSPSSLFLDHAFSHSTMVASAATTSTVYSMTHSITTATTTTKEFEPLLPDVTALLGIGAVLIVSAAAAWVWANQVVPTSRTKLALSKRQGGVKQYLDELELELQLQAQQGDNNNRQLEQWLFTDWLEQRNATATAGRQKEPALPIFKKAKWNSGDNPVLVATALIIAGVIFASITEQIATFFS